MDWSIHLSRARSYICVGCMCLFNLNTSLCMLYVYSTAFPTVVEMVLCLALTALALPVINLERIRKRIRVEIITNIIGLKCMHLA